MGTAVLTPRVCTSWYRAPELLFLDVEGVEVTEARYGAAVDVWSLGCIVYELVAGCPLCRARDDKGMVANLFTVWAFRLSPARGARRLRSRNGHKVGRSTLPFRPCVLHRERAQKTEFGRWCLQPWSGILR